MLKVGITGGIGSGKTTVCRVFEILGIPVFYADNAAKSIMHTDVLLKQDIIAGFGENSYFESGELNRKHISSIVFNNDEQLNKLNALVHPAVFRAFDAWVALHSLSPYVIKEAALLFESESHKMCDQSILVKSPEHLKIARIVARDQTTPREIKLRMDKQLSDKQKETLADHVLVNDEQTMLVPQILTLHNHFLNLAHDH